MAGMKNWIKQPKNKIKLHYYDANRGTYVMDDGMPAGHGGKLTHTFVMAGAQPANLVIPAGFNAMITRVEWAFTVFNVGNQELYLLSDGLPNVISQYFADIGAGLISPFDSLSRQGDGSGVLGIATGNLNIIAQLFGLWGTAEIVIEYYLEPIV